MKPPPVADRHAPVDRVAQELVPEVVQPARPGRLEDEVVDELLERGVKGIGRQIHDAGQDLGDEAATHDRTRPGDLLCFRGAMAESRQNGVLDRVRDSRLPDREAIRPRLGVESPEELLDVERDPVRPIVDGVSDLARGRQTRVEDERGHERGFGFRQRRQPDLLGDALGQEPGAPVPQGRARRSLVGPVPTAQQQVPITRAARQLGDDLEAQVVGPLQVLEPEEQCDPGAPPGWRRPRPSPVAGGA